jgi:ABC-2 type transport system ATP-binding protein
MAQLVIKTSGQVSIWDIDLDRDPRSAASAIGVVPQELNIDPFFTPRELLELQAGLYGVPKAERRTKEILAAVGLSDKAEAYARTLSGGMRRRLMVAKALVHSPPVLVLDEPTAGVDVELRRQLWAYVRELNAQGVTVVLTTHYLEEAQELCDTIAIINHGELVACEATAQLLTRVDHRTLHIEPLSPLTAVPGALAHREVSLKPGGGLAIRFRRESAGIEALLAEVNAAGVAIRDLRVEEPDLEDVFLALTARAA